jgi:threonine dehydratase
LISGISSYLKAVAPGIGIIGCQPAASAVMYESVKAGEIVVIDSRPTLSDATAGGIESGSITFDLCRRHVDSFELLDEIEIAEAIRFVHKNESMVIEGGAALPVAAVLRRPVALQGKTLVLIVTGSKIDDDVLGKIVS